MKYTEFHIGKKNKTIIPFQLSATRPMPSAKCSKAKYTLRWGLNKHCQLFDEDGREA